MTNVDVWNMQDSRYENAVKFMEDLGRENVYPDGKSIIKNVLWRDGVIQDDTIFTAAISSKIREQIYDSPDKQSQFLQ